MDIFLYKYKRYPKNPLLHPKIFQDKNLIGNIFINTVFLDDKIDEFLIKSVLYGYNNNINNNDGVSKLFNEILVKNIITSIESTEEYKNYKNDIEHNSIFFDILLINKYVELEYKCQSKIDFFGTLNLFPVELLYNFK